MERQRLAVLWLKLRHIEVEIEDGLTQRVLGLDLLLRQSTARARPTRLSGAG